MRQAVMEDFVERAMKSQSALGKAAAASAEVGVIVPSVLKAKLEEAGFKIETKPGKASGDRPGHGVHLEVYGKKNDLDGVLVAYAFASDEGEALVQAIAAELRDEVTETVQ